MPPDTPSNSMTTQCFRGHLHTCYKDKYILGRIGLYFWGFGEKLNYFLGFGERLQILLGKQGHYLQGDGEINALFSRIKAAQTPGGFIHVILSMDSMCAMSIARIGSRSHCRYVAAV